MNKLFSSVVVVIIIMLLSCSRKHTPEKTTAAEEVVVVKPVIKKPKKKVYTPKQKDIIPNAITVNDKVARKSVDGRLYYDLLGNRYWKNYKDGKYYLFSQKMYDNPDFKPK